MSGLNATEVGSLITAATGALPPPLKAGYADALWLMLCGFLVFFMQCGFALLEAGTVRAKNTKNILLKNLLDACVGAMIWWSFGHSIAVRVQSFPAHASRANALPHARARPNCICIASPERGPICSRAARAHAPCTV